MGNELSLMRQFPAGDGEQVTIANMQEDPFNRWAFPHLRRLLPTANVWRGDGSVTELPAAPAYLDDIVFEDRDGKAQTVKQHLDGGYTDGFCRAARRCHGR